MSNHNHHAHSNHHVPQNKTVLKNRFYADCKFYNYRIFGRLFFNSLALTADTNHMANDSFSLGLALLALHVADKSPRLEKYILGNRPVPFFIIKTLMSIILAIVEAHFSVNFYSHSL